MPDYKNIAKKAAAKTDSQLRKEIESITKLSPSQIEALFPRSDDRQKLDELMEIVKGAQDRNEKVIKIVKNAEKFGGLVVAILEKVI